MTSGTGFFCVLAAIALVFLSSPTSGDVGDCMRLDRDEMTTDVRFNVIDRSCDAEGVCGYLLRIPSRSSSGDLTIVSLVIYDAAGVDVLSVELDFRVLDDGTAEIHFFAHDKYSKSLVVRAGYKAAGQCSRLAEYRPTS